MHRLIFPLAFMAIFIASCNYGNSKGTNTTITSSPDTAKQDITPVKSWYKRFTGTIGGQEVVVNLNLVGRNELRATYSHNNKGILLELNSKIEACSNNQFYLNETEPTAPPDERGYDNGAHWFVTLKGDKLTGKWVSKDESKTCDIDLREDYSNGAISFGVFSSIDSITVKHGKAEVTAKKSFLWPEPDDKLKREEWSYLESVLVRVITYDDDSLPQSITSLVDDGNTDFFENFKSEIDKEGNIDPGSVLMYSQENENKIWVDYNQNGFVVFEDYFYEYMGGAHGLYSSRFTCADLQEKRVWSLKDIMKVDTAKLLAMITATARQVFSVPADSSLSTRSLSDTIPFTDNFYFTHTGIVFNYVPYQISGFAQGEVRFFLPFNHLSDMLTPDFKRRMKL